MLHLHGGWGYAIYDIQRQIEALPDLRFIIPDRTGYGRAPRLRLGDERLVAEQKLATDLPSIAPARAPPNPWFDDLA